MRTGEATKKELRVDRTEIYVVVIGCKDAHESEKKETSMFTTASIGFLVCS